jgi:hypothetical protein
LLFHKRSLYRYNLVDGPLAPSKLKGLRAGVAGGASVAARAGAAAAGAGAGDGSAAAAGAPAAVAAKETPMKSLMESLTGKGKDVGNGYVLFKFDDKSD